MSATGNELVKLSQLRGTINGLRTDLQSANLTNTNTSIIRTTGGSLAIKDGQELVKKVEGQSYVWNQVLENGNFESLGNWYMASSQGTLIIANNTLTITLASTGVNGIRTSCSFNNQHKYIILFDVLTKNNEKIRATFGLSSQSNYTNAPTSNVWSNVGLIADGSTTENYLRITFDCTTGYSVGDTIQVKNIHIHDLTAMGLGNITTVDQFKALFPNTYYPYQAPTLCSSNNEYKNIGRNLWDEETEKGNIDSSGVKENQNDRIRSKNYIVALPNTSYYVKSSVSDINVYLYDNNKNFVGRATSSGSFSVGNAIFTTPNSTSYMLFKFPTSYGTTYNHDICINKSDASFNGTYEPYQSNLLSYNGTLERKVGSVKLKDLDWLLSGSISNGFFANVSDGKGSTPNVITKNYHYANNTTNGYITTQTNNNQLRVFIVDSNYNDTTAFKNHFTDDDVLYYELATPTTETIVNATNVELKGVGTAKDTLYNESGLASWKNGLTEQVNKNGIVAIPYSVSEEFAVSINGQLQHNLEVDKSQQEEIQKIDGKLGTKLEEVKASDVDSESATSGQVLTADGSGGASWQSASGGTTLNKYTFDATDTQSNRAIFFRIINNAKGHICAFNKGKELPITWATYSWNSSYVNAVGSMDSAQSMLFLSRTLWQDGSMTGTLGWYINSSNAIGHMSITPFDAGFKVVYWNDTEIT